MTTISIRDAVILNHLSKQAAGSQPKNLTDRLESNARELADQLKRQTPTTQRGRTSRSR
ncbi:hypothetical protein Terro_3110 [Terriglobus roseus DSM 18391]|uniref:Uncharacterized protein n=1 Tax=Terriglobus roseus (strain DSM 18391 / NRRL B-41598 / KBS 63) TaxID=926566 RepID=I3ZJC2_TERRK|nr:hypothetical protein Terro_3110 [Terriglobus roseus DSM 18391]